VYYFIFSLARSVVHIVVSFSLFSRNVEDLGLVQIRMRYAHNFVRVAVDNIDA